MTTTIATALLHALKDRGADRLFGIPGDFVLPFFRVIEDSAILPWHTLSHEPGVGYAADAAGRITSTLGVAVVTYGAGGAEHRQRGGPGLCREIAAGGDLGRARRAGGQAGASACTTRSSR